MRKICERSMEALAEALLDNQLTMRAAARMAGVDTVTAMAWAAKNGIQPSRRPKLLRDEIRRVAIEQLHAGHDKAFVAVASGVSVGTITTLLRTEVGLHESWEMARKHAASTAARFGWLASVERNRNAGVKIARAQASAEYAWLYRNERSWLLAHLPSSPPVHKVFKARVCWYQRDLALCREVENAVARLKPSCRTNARAIRLWELCKEVPDLHAKLNQRKKLPLTCEAINRAISGRPEGE